MRPETITHRCSTSVGVTMFSGHQADESKIINLADQAMYRAKKRGRNRAVVTREDDAVLPPGLADQSTAPAWKHNLRAWRPEPGKASPGPPASGLWQWPQPEFPRCG